MKLSNNDNKQYKHVTLDNGLRVLLITDPSSEKSAASLTINVGHFDDPVGRQGMAHFIEHMLFLGTEQYPIKGEFSQIVSQSGGNSNAWTGTEHTCYFFDCLSPKLDHLLSRFSDFFIAPLFEQSALNDERNAIDAEFNLKVKDDNRRIIQAHKETANPAHPFTKFSVGNHDTLGDSHGDIRKEIIHFFQQYYQAQWMTLVIAGPQPSDELERLAYAHFSAIQGNIKHRKPKISSPFYRAEDLGIKLHIKPRKHLQKLIVSFAMPNIDELYRYKSLSFLAHLLGYEGEGSLYAILKKNGWINALSAGGGVNGSNFKDFNISFALTDLGIEFYEDIVELLFEYISLIKAQQHVLPALYADKKQLMELAFDNQEVNKLIDWVSNVSVNMHHYSEEYTLYGDYCMECFNQALHDELIGYLCPNNMRLVLIHPTAIDEEGAVNKVAKWYNTPYQVAQIDKEWLEALSRIHEPLPEMRLPNVNPYLSDDNTLHDIESTAHIPTQLQDRPGFAFWFKQDATFRVTKGHFYLELDSEASIESHKAMALTRLFADLFMDSVAEQFYSAELAGLSYHLTSHQGGLTLHTAGLSSCQLKLASQLVEALQKQPISAARFAEYKKQLIRHWQNHNKNKPVSELFSLLGAKLMPWNPTPNDLAKALQNVCFNEFNSFRDSFFTSIHAKAFLHGNWQQQHALGIKQQLLCNFAKSEILEDLKKPLNTIDESYEASFINEQNEHAFVHYIQAPSQSVQDKIKIMAFNQLVSQLYFEKLRTERQLGYLVGAGYAPFNTRAGIAFYIQSPKFNSRELLQQHQLFLADFVNNIDSMDGIHWHDVKSSLQSQIAEKDKNLRLRSQRFWIAIGNEDHTFSMQTQLLEALDKLTFAELKAFIATVTEQSFPSIILRNN
ncbi:peptidase [Pseudoalteromonas luteoviolacea]|uniref:Protease 3 n=1 Tax=Pseudoalteromonas luteoviolacea TaxID=43657 RepID=A0A0C1Q598_9GAMM|nr:insulinase family protein [Pseudoalteromonas luteoviolacea]KID54670.1 peptidase [Pseudoalteromonas luteoviolacea]